MHYLEAVQGMVQTMDVILDICLVSKYPMHQILPSNCIDPYSPKDTIQLAIPLYSNLILLLGSFHHGRMKKCVQVIPPLCHT